MVAALWAPAVHAEATENPSSTGQSETAAQPAVTPSAEAEVTTTDEEVPTVGTISVRCLAGKPLGVPQGTVQDIYL